jgi:DNA-binding beta-propeller fold protein YncE
MAASAQTGSSAPVSGPMRAVDTPLGLMVGDYVGGNIVFLDRKTLAVNDTLLLPVEDQDPGPIMRTKPLGVAFMNGRFYVGDERSESIQVYVKPGAIKKNGEVEKNPKNIGEWVQVTASLTAFPIPGPSDIVADEDLGLLFVASRGDRTVYVLDADGELIRTIGGAAPLGRPQGLALDLTGQRVYVSDDGPRRCGDFGACFGEVHVYSYAGDFLGQISGKFAPENFRFSRAQGLTVDSFGDVYLVDSWRGQVLVFREVDANIWSGIGTFGSKGAGVKQLLLPMDVVVDYKPSTVYVTNSIQRRIEVFAIKDMVP